MGLETPKNCLNCKHFKRYYIKYYQKFKPIDKGFCGNVSISSKHRYKQIADCDKWEAIPEPKETYLKIEEEIRDMCKRLKEIAVFLKNYEN